MYLYDDCTNPEYTLPVHCEIRSYLSKSGENTRHTLFFAHNHSTLEILRIKKGTMQFRLDGVSHDLKPGFVVICNPFSIHGGMCDTDGVEYESYFISLSKMIPYPNSKMEQCVNALLSGSAMLDSIYSPDDPETSVLTALLIDLEDALSGNTLIQECQVLTTSLSFLGLLFSNHFRQQDHPPRQKRDISFLQTVSQYLAEHYPEDISSASASRYLHMEHTAFCHKFRNQFGNSFSRYLCRYRILRAAYRFQNESMPISQIAEAVGFSDYCYFSKSFKSVVGLSPARYFHRWKSISPKSGL